MYYSSELYESEIVVWNYLGQILASLHRIVNVFVEASGQESF